MSEHIAEGWDEAMCRAHLADLRTDLDRYEHTADAMREAADDWERQARHRRSQLDHCIATFGAPKPPPPATDGAAT